MGIGLIKIAQRIQKTWKPGILDVASANNKGLSAFLNGKTIEKYNGEIFIPGVRHIVVGTRFNRELKEMQELRCILNDSSIAKKIAIENSIPSRLRNVFDDIVLSQRDNVTNSNLIEKMADGASKMRRSYDKLINNPVAKTKRKLYMGWQSIREKFTDIFRKHRTVEDIDVAFVKQFVPGYIKVPENTTKEELQLFLTDMLKKSQFSDKDIKRILDGKSPYFYRFIGGAELRALKNGHRVSSAAGYNSDYARTDVTHLSQGCAMPGYNPYRVMFKRKADFAGANIEAHDPSHGKWWLHGGYTKDDIVCVERVK